MKRLNEEKGFAVAIMIDTEENEIHMGNLVVLCRTRLRICFIIMN